MERNVKELEARLEERFRKRGYPGMSVCIRGPEGILYEKGFGYRSIEHRKPVDADTVFGIASMSKSMTALACCILQAEGKMSLEDPVVNYFPDFHIPGAPDECVTVRTLAMHRSGLPPMEPLEWSIAMNSKERDTHWYREMVRTAPNKMDRIEQIVENGACHDGKTVLAKLVGYQLCVNRQVAVRAKLDGAVTGFAGFLQYARPGR